MALDYCERLGIHCPEWKKGRCPRSQVRRQFEYGNAQSIWGWRFICETCKVGFLYTERKMAQAGIELGRITKLKEAEERNARRKTYIY